LALKKESSETRNPENKKDKKEKQKKKAYTLEPFIEELLKEEKAEPETNAESSSKDITLEKAFPVQEKTEDALEKSDADDVKSSARGDVPMSVVGHLDELRSRLIVTLVTVLVITIISFFVAGELLDIITRPFYNTGNRLNIFNLTEGFMLNLKSSLIAGVLAGLPVIVFELWKYIVPAIETKNRRFIGFSVAWALALFYAGILFTYFVMMPVTVHMLLRFTPPDMTITVGADKYFSFVIIFSLSAAAIFELPAVILILTRIGIVTPEFLISKRKYAIISIWVLAAVITPPDALTQIMLAIPLMLLYEISIIISKIVLKRRKKKELEKYI
jgi:sec-independent protein translocase protein TatC